MEKSPQVQNTNKQQTPHSNEGHKDHTSGDEARNNVGQTETENQNLEVPEVYEYQPYQHLTKTVEFTNEVIVVHFNGEEVIGESTEPLKKELDQQIRNKEMRRGHTPTTLGSKRKLSDDHKNPLFQK